MVAVVNNKNYMNLNKYYRVKNGKVFDTTFLFPHVECYFVVDNSELWYESIDGQEFYLGKIVATSNNLSELDEAEK